jgi:lipopolysaccharide transport system permease protein
MAQLIIEAGRSEGQYWRDLWRYRELFYVLAWRDITVRYKQTAIGILWALLQPFIGSILLTVVFQRFAHMPTIGNAPYFLVVFAANMPWQFFANSLSGASQSVIGSAGLISKVYFPRLIVPAGAVVTALADLCISMVLLVGIMAFFHFVPSWHILFLPFFVLLAFAAALGPGLLLTALTVKYRDFRIITPFIIQIGQLASPVGYATPNFPPGKWQETEQLLYSLNPMVGVIDGFRWSILGSQAPLDLRSFSFSIAIAFALMFLGIWYFRHTERSFADQV